VAGFQVPNHISVYNLDTNIQFILNCAPIQTVYRNMIGHLRSSHSRHFFHLLIYFQRSRFIYYLLSIFKVNFNPFLRS